MGQFIFYRALAALCILVVVGKCKVTAEPWVMSQATPVPVRTKPMKMSHHNNNLKTTRPPKPKRFNFVYTEGRVTCIMVQFAAQVDVMYYAPDELHKHFHSPTTHFLFNFHSLAKAHSGSCDENEQWIKIEFAAKQRSERQRITHYLTFLYTKTESNYYQRKSLKLTLEADYIDKNMSSHQIDLMFFSKWQTPIGTTYGCDEVKMNLTPEKTNATGSLHLFQVKEEAFRKKRFGTFSNEIRKFSSDDELITTTKILRSKFRPTTEKTGTKQTTAVDTTIEKTTTRQKRTRKTTSVMKRTRKTTSVRKRTRKTTTVRKRTRKTTTVKSRRSPALPVEEEEIVALDSIPAMPDDKAITTSKTSSVSYEDEEDVKKATTTDEEIVVIDSITAVPEAMPEEILDEEVDMTTESQLNETAKSSLSVPELSQQQSPEVLPFTLNQVLYIGIGSGLGGLLLGMIICCIARKRTLTRGYCYCMKKLAALRSETTPTK